jgi:site-specific DNA-cytosine methylase
MRLAHRILLFAEASLMKVLDLFCGAGGIAHGFLKGGFNVTSVDNSEYVEATFAENNHADFQNANLMQEVIRQQCDVITGGPPHRLGENARLSFLTWE